MKQYYVYILTNKKHGTFYIGVTSDLVKRVYEHKKKLVDGFTKQYDLTNLVYYEAHNDIEQAILREKKLKKWRREWKLKLVNDMNPYWEDLAAKL